MRKGQITLFIVIGILVLLLISLSIYMWTSYEKKMMEEAVLPSVQKIPSEIQPLRDYMTTCIYTIAKEAIIKLGDHGGYIDSKQFSFNPISPTEGDGVLFSPDSDLVIPYWWHLESDNDCEGNCRFSSKRPELYGTYSIEKQFEDYVAANIPRCLQNFDQFAAQGFELLDAGKIKVDATIASGNIVLYSEYPLKIKKAGKTFTIPDYSAALDVDLKGIYSLGTEISNQQAEHRILEKHTRQLIDMFSRLESDALPPVSDIDVGFGAGTIWVEFDVIDKVKQMLASYTRMIQIGGTRNYRFIEAPSNMRDPELYETVYNRGMIMIMPDIYPSLNANLQYLNWWNPYFNLNCQGQLCKAESASTTFLGFVFGVQTYDFAYDISHPVLVEITEPNAFGGEGYSFKFFLESNLRDNMPMPAEYTPLKDAAIARKTMFCDKNQRISANVSVKVIDGSTKNPVDSVEITYNCGKETCSIGRTDENGLLITNFPICIDGVVIAEKLDYHPSYEIFETDKDEEKSITIVLQPYRLMDFSVKHWLLKKGTNWELDTDSPFHQSSDETTLIMLEREAEEFEEPFTAFAEVCGGEFKSQVPCGRPPEDFSKEIRMLPGNYKVRIYSFKYPQPAVEFPPDKRCFGAGFSVECYTIPEESIIFDKKNAFPIGIAEFEWKLGIDELDAADSIEFYNFELAISALPAKNRKIEDLGELGKMKEYAKVYRSYLEPKLE